MRSRNVYRCVAESPEGFISQVVRYVSSGHYFYITGVIPDGKSPERIDRKLLDLYDIDRPKWARQRRYLKKLAGIHYLRSERFWVIMLTKGEHPRFYADHGGRLCDIRRTALKFRGYSIRYSFSEVEQKPRVFVRLDKPTYRMLKKHYLELSVSPRFREKSRLESELRSRMAAWQPYGPVRGQLLGVVRAVNRLRRRAGHGPVSEAIIPERMKLVRVFDEERAVSPSDAV